MRETSTRKLFSENPRKMGLLLLLLAVILLSVYPLVRFRGRWGEADTFHNIRYTQNNLAEGTLEPSGEFYVNGYGYQVFTLMIHFLGGLSLVEIQIFGSSLLMIWVLFPAWLLYRELTDSTTGATLAAIFLFVQPEFLFPLLRGTHEKFARGLMFLCLYFLVRSLRLKTKTAHAVGFIVAFYLSGYALITFNNLIATSFIFGLFLSILLSYLLLRKRSFVMLSLGESSVLPRMVLVVISTLVLAFVFTFYLYPPAQTQLLIMKNIWERLSALFLQVEETATNPYSVIGYLWTSLPVYFLISLSNWVILIVSIWFWFRMGMRFLKSNERSGRRELLLWSFYTAFAVQGAASILVDISGALSSNLQHRFFPSFVMLAAPLVADNLLKIEFKNKRWQNFVRATMLLMIGVLSILAVFKATTEPLVSNKWVFYLPAEMTTLDWADTKLTGRELWTGFDERLIAAKGIKDGGIQSDANLVRTPYVQDASNMLVSDAIRLLSSRLRIPISVEFDDYLAYDNGQAEVYHQRPRTPYQR
jgi:hypothetical protein